MKLKLPYPSLLILLFTVVGVMLLVENVKGQDCTPKKRRYSTRQEFYGQALLGILLPGTISDGAKAVDGDLKTFSTLSVDVGVLNQSQATQYLEFTSGSTYIPANTPVTVRMSLPTSILGVLDNVKLQPFKNLNYNPGIFGVGARWEADAVGSAFTGAALVNLVNGVGELEFTITPTQQYQGIWVNIGSVVGVGVSANIYSAYVTENDLTTAACNNPIDVLAGVKAGLVGGVLDATASVTGQYYAIDTDPLLTTFAELNAGVNLVGEIYHTTIFKTQAQPGDVVKMIVEKPGGGLLNLGVLSGFSIQLYNGPNAVGVPLTSSSTGLLSLNLLPGAAIGETKRELMIAVPASYGAYDRVQVKIGGVATVGLEPGLRIYDVKRIIQPTLLIDGNQVASKDVCFGNTAILSVSETQYCTTYNWYKTAVGGTAVHTGTTAYTPLASSLIVGDNIFYLEATRTNCTETSGRIPVKIIVNALPSAPTVPGKAICTGTATTLSVTSPDANYTYKWYTVSSGGISFNTGTSYTTPTLTTAKDYYVEATNNTTTCVGTRAKVTVNINALPSAGTITGNAGVCLGQTTSLTNATPGGLWTSSDETKATVDGTGTVTGIAVGTATITYTVTDPGTTCTNSTTMSVTVNALPIVNSITGNSSLCVGNTITLANSTPGGIWASSNPTSATINSSGLVTGLVAGQTIITYTVTSNGCSTPAIRVIDINPLPTASLSGTTTVCQGTSSPTVTFTGASGTAPYTFTYNINGGSNTTITTTSGNSVSLTIPTTTSGTFNYNLISIKDNSSTQCAQSQSGTATIIINPKPIHPVTSISSN
ncbi:Ig-like domain-containing protein [Pedobacter frigoris]|uniref:Ig-like domain-containing protein n=1 Tax=Pedobacter frigoris TaxID=2571272 RepID=UPI00292CBF7C|nr:Ig-like domain-containing protein [Pedobacter frigoris]